MLTRTVSTLLRLRVTVTYAATLVAVATTLLMLGPRVQDMVISHMSTNLHNLAHGRLGTLVGSAFVTSDGPMWAWLPGLVCLLALAELLWRSGRVLITFALGHLGATLIVATGLAASIKFGWLPISVAHTTDVGISYGAAAVLGALTAAIPSRWRPAWIGWWLSVGLLAACVGVAGVPVGGAFTGVGHFVALLLGIPAVDPLRRGRPLDASPRRPAHSRRVVRLPGAGQLGAVTRRRAGGRCGRCARRALARRPVAGSARAPCARRCRCCDDVTARLHPL